MHIYVYIQKLSEFSDTYIQLFGILISLISSALVAFFTVTYTTKRSIRGKAISKISISFVPILEEVDALKKPTDIYDYLVSEKHIAFYKQAKLDMKSFLLLLPSYKESHRKRNKKIMQAKNELEELLTISFKTKFYRIRQGDIGYEKSLESLEKYRSEVKMAVENFLFLASKCHHIYS